MRQGMMGCQAGWSNNINKSPKRNSSLLDFYEILTNNTFLIELRFMKGQQRLKEKSTVGQFPIAEVTLFLYIFLNFGGH